MPKFRYVASRDGASERGTLIAESKAEAVAKLKGQGYAGVRVKRAATETGSLFKRFFGKQT